MRIPCHRIVTSLKGYLLTLDLNAFFSAGQKRDRPFTAVASQPDFLCKPVNACNKIVNFVNII